MGRVFCDLAIVTRGVARGGPRVPVTPPFGSFFKQTTYNRWRKQHDNLVSTLILTHCDPPLKNPGYAPGNYGPAELNLEQLNMILVTAGQEYFSPGLDLDYSLEGAGYSNI